MSATALAKYLILRADRQETVLHDSRFSRPPIVTANAEALRALRAYHCDPTRPKDALDQVKGALATKAEAIDTRPKKRDEALRCIEILDLFERRENGLGLRQMSLSAPPHRFEQLVIEGVSLSIQPDFLVDGGAGRVGAGNLHVAKSPDLGDCKAETSQRRGDYRREMARYIVAMLQMLLDAQGGKYGRPDRTLCFVADLRLAEKIGPASDHTARLRAIRAACAQIATLWPAIQPRPSILRK
jgi:hypothetical protein